jgi:hypothetical protein
MTAGNIVHCWHSSYNPLPVGLTTASLDPTIERCPGCGIPVAVRSYAASTLVVPPEHAPPAETKAARQRRINRERLRETAAERRQEQRALARSGRVA